jgi:hypothetical protein
MNLSNLNQPILTFKGEPIRTPTGKRITDPDGSSHDETTELTMQSALLQCLVLMKVEPGEESFRVFTLGTRLASITDQDPTMGIDSKDMAMLQHAINQNVVGYQSFIQGELWKYLKDIDEADKTPSKK